MKRRILGLLSPLAVSLFVLLLLVHTALAQVPRGFSIPLIDLAGQTERQVVVDREPGQYLGHPTTVLLEDGKSMIVVYPKGHGRGAIVMKRSVDGGKTWSDRLSTPENWATSLETPTIHRLIDPQGKKRLVLFSGLYPIRIASSEDDGATWTPLEPIGDFGGIVAMASVERLRDGSYMALFHDDGRFFRNKGKTEGFRVYKTISNDGGRTWAEPEVIASHPEAHLCEPGLVRSPDGKQLAVLLRENSRKFNSFVIFSDDEGKSWTAPRELPGALTGDRHVGKYGPDGRLFLSFRDTTHESPTRGDWVGWVGTYDDIVQGREGQYRIRLMDNKKDADCAYPGVEVLPDGTFVTTTYGHWQEGESPYIVSVRFRLDELDELAKQANPTKAARETIIDVSTVEELRLALRQARAGTTIRLASGRYPGGISAPGLQGEPGKPIVVAAADPARPPIIEGGGSGLHLIEPAHVELRHLVIEKAEGNGLNIDDGGSPETPAHHVLLDSLVVRDVGPGGNRDGIKLSGLDDFRVENCRVERWGDGGSGIDMVGCHRGEIVGCLFRHTDPPQANGVQAKGGSSAIRIVACRFENPGGRAINLGGSTGRPYFRPPDAKYEARDLLVEQCVFIGSMAPVAFVGVDGAEVRYNTIYRPRKWVIRVLQENREEGMIPSQRGRLLGNLIVYRADEMTLAMNVGAGTSPGSFQLIGNAWYRLDSPGQSRPALPIEETRAFYGIDPLFRNAEEGDFTRTGRTTILPAGSTDRRALLGTMP